MWGHRKGPTDPGAGECGENELNMAENYTLPNVLPSALS